MVVRMELPRHWSWRVVLRNWEMGIDVSSTPGWTSALVLVYLACLASGHHGLVPDSDGPNRAFADNLLRRHGVCSHGVCQETNFTFALRQAIVRIRTR
jgi:hypothetical protein